jgi:hypothetical protein
VKDCSAACPFCGAVVATTACLDSSRPAPHVSRSALFVGASVVLAVSNCGTYGGSCPVELDLESPCGFLLVESSCSDGIPTCKKNGAPTFTTCKVVPKSNCTVVVMLGDGTEQTVTVKVDQCVTPGFVSFASATCKAPMILDAGTDASDANVDDANDAMTADAPD